MEAQGRGQVGSNRPVPQVALGESAADGNRLLPDLQRLPPALLGLPTLVRPPAELLEGVGQGIG